MKKINVPFAVGNPQRIRDYIEQQEKEFGLKLLILSFSLTLFSCLLKPDQLNLVATANFILCFLYSQQYFRVTVSGKKGLF